jgi:hypothetical protein
MNGIRRCRAAVCVAVVIAASAWFAACDDNGSPTTPTSVAATGSPVQTPLPRFDPPVAGEYTLTITASSSCTLPLEARQRRYTATIEETSREAVTVVLSGADFRWGTGQFPNPLNNRFQGARGASALRFNVFVGERVDDTKEISYEGIGETTLAGSTISGAFNGTIWLNAAGNLFDGIADCTAPDHAMEFVRR